MRTSHKPNFSRIGLSGDEIWQLPVPKVQVWNGWTWPSGFPSGLSKMSKNYTLGTWIYHFSGRVHLIWLKFGLWVGLLFLIGFIEVKKTLGQLQPFQTWTLGTGSCHISSPDGPIWLKFGLWLVLMIILVPYIHKKTARVAGTTLNLESTLTLTLEVVISHHPMVRFDWNLDCG